jgi:hypothetical protein
MYREGQRHWISGTGIYFLPHSFISCLHTYTIISRLKRNKGTKREDCVLTTILVPVPYDYADGCNRTVPVSSYNLVII